MPINGSLERVPGPTAAVILAAGGSSRLGRPKQLLEFGGETLLRRTARAALEAGCRPVLAVLGASARRVGTEIEDLAVQAVLNSRWKRGMSASLISGIEYLRGNNPEAAGAIVLACDQPYVDAELLSDLIEIHARSGLPIAACCYRGELGVPALFGRQVFDELVLLRGDRGAKSVLAGNPARVAAVDFPKGATDIDTAADYRDLLDAE